jgi:hypothetical protein
VIDTPCELTVVCSVEIEDDNVDVVFCSVVMFALCPFTVLVNVETELEMAESALARVLSSAVMRAIAAATPVVGLLTVDSRVVAREASADV